MEPQKCSTIKHTYLVGKKPLAAYKQVAIALITEDGIVTRII
jgi:hypothetical protein